jgi:hypothetical protein
MTLYHPDLYMPTVIDKALPSKGKMMIIPSKHALEQAQKKGFNLPNAIDFSESKLFEVEVLGRSITKIAYRTPYNKRYELCLVINPLNHLIVTAWLNDITDNHYSLDVSKYSRSPL